MSNIIYYLQEDLPYQPLSEQESIELTMLINDDRYYNSLTFEEKVRKDELKMKKQIFEDFVFKNFDFQLIYQQTPRGRWGLPIVTKFIYVNMNSGFKRSDYEKQLSSTSFSDKWWKLLHDNCYPILNHIWADLKLHDKQVYEPMRNNIHMRSPSHHKALYLLPTTEPIIYNRK